MPLFNRLFEPDSLLNPDRKKDLFSSEDLSGASAVLEEQDKKRDKKKALRDSFLQALPYIAQILTSKTEQGLSSAIENFQRAQELSKERIARRQEKQEEFSFRSTEAEKERKGQEKLTLFDQRFRGEESEKDRALRKEEGELERTSRSELQKAEFVQEKSMQDTLLKFQENMEAQRQEHSVSMANLGHEFDQDLQERTFANQMTQQLSNVIDPVLAKSIGDKISERVPLNDFNVDERLALYYYQEQIDSKIGQDRLNSVLNLLKTGSAIPVPVTRQVLDPNTGAMIEIEVTDPMTKEPVLRPRTPSEILSILGPKAREAMMNLGVQLPDEELIGSKEGNTVAQDKAADAFSSGVGKSGSENIQERARFVDTEEEMALFMEALMEGISDKNELLGLIEGLPWDENKKRLARSIISQRQVSEGVHDTIRSRNDSSLISGRYPR